MSKTVFLRKSCSRCTSVYVGGCKLVTGHLHFVWRCLRVKIECISLVGPSGNRLAFFLSDSSDQKAGNFSETPTASSKRYPFSTTNEVTENDAHTLFPPSPKHLEWQGAFWRQIYGTWKTHACRDAGVPDYFPDSALP